MSINDTPVDDLSPLLEWAEPIKCLAITGTPISDISLLLDIDWNMDEYGCYSSCPSLQVDENQLDDFSKQVVIPQLCDMGVDVNGCLSCPQ
ncbi:MAG: hypothetical protein HC927_06040 [Deltaproteobacteria bacterium]|nr:hypothetical protein [Deltaproteobacteria bacterium]